MHTYDDKLLRESIRQILREEAGPGKIMNLLREMEHFNKTCELKGLYITLGIGVRNAGTTAFINFAIKNKDGKVEVIYPGLDRWMEVIESNIDPESTWSAEDLRNEIPEPPYGSIQISPQIRSSDGPCLNGWAVNVTSETTQGWGPLLYDIAIELASQEAGGLTSDRSEVSDSARGVWEKYASSRPDVDKMQLDDFDNPITPNPEDDCLQISAQHPFHADWQYSPLSKMYRKSPVIMGRLESLGMLF